MKSTVLDRLALFEFEQFFDRLRDVEQSKSINKSDEAESFVRGWPRFASELRLVLTRARNIEQKSASSYNIFRLLGIEHDEERTHSRFLSDLLDPAGMHGQQEAFLKIFLEHCHDLLGRPPLAQEAYTQHWIVECERGIPTGRIDILLRCSSINYVAIIENKIFAPEQANQINRYEQWLRSWHFQPAQRLIVFLTPDGRPPRSGRNVECLPLSYRGDIAKMLMLLRLGSDAVNLSVIIQHYLSVVTKLVPAEDSDETNGR